VDVDFLFWLLVRNVREEKRENVSRLVREKNKQERKERVKNILRLRENLKTIE
jgi:hypothetical protein